LYSYSWLLRWGLNIFGIIFTAALLDNFNVTLLGAIFGSVFLGLVNVFIRPILLLLTLPINILSLGLFTLIINALMLWLTSLMIKGFDITSFGTAIIAAIIIALLNFFFNLILGQRKYQFYYRRGRDWDF
jgi:putative membrane protein